MTPYYLLLVGLGLISVALGVLCWIKAYRLIRGYFTTANQIGRATFERTNAHGAQEFSSWAEAKATRRSEGFADMRSGIGLLASPLLFLVGCLFMSGGYFAANGIAELSTMTEAEFQAAMTEAD